MSESMGIHQSGKFLVIERQRARFPSHCIWCNADRATPADVSLMYSPVQLRGRAGVIGVARMFAALRRCTIGLPVCETCRKKPLKRGSLGAYICLGSWALALGLLFALDYSDLKPSNPIMIAGFIVVVIGIALGFVGLFVGYLAQRRGGELPVAYIDDQVVWMRDPNPAWLAALPMWQGQVPEHLRG